MYSVIGLYIAIHPSGPVKVNASRLCSGEERKRKKSGAKLFRGWWPSLHRVLAAHSGQPGHRVSPALRHVRFLVNDAQKRLIGIHPAALLASHFVDQAQSFSPAIALLTVGMSILINPDSDCHGQPDTEWHVKPDTCSTIRTSNCTREYATKARLRPKADLRNLNHMASLRRVE